MSGTGDRHADPDGLGQFTETTRAHYDRVAVEFQLGTRDHDVSQNYQALLEAIKGPPPFSILDIGCGPGRDLKYFRNLGHDATGLDGSAAFAAMAHAATGCTVLHQDFLDMDLPTERFDGVFANASLFHVPSRALPRVLSEIAASLKSNGVLFCSNPRGNNEEGMNAGRYGCFHDQETWHRYVTAAGFSEIRHYFRPEGKPRDQQPWLATVWRKT